MSTVILNKSNNFRANVTATATTPTIIFHVKGAKADCLVYMPPGGALVGSARAVAAGDVAKVNGAVRGNQIQVQINPADLTLGNATVSY